MKEEKSIVYVIQEIPGTNEGRPKINIIGASQYGEFKFLLPELSQIIFSPGPLIFKLRSLLKNYSSSYYMEDLNKLFWFLVNRNQKVIDYFSQ